MSDYTCPVAGCETLVAYLDGPLCASCKSQMFGPGEEHWVAEALLRSPQSISDPMPGSQAIREALARVAELEQRIAEMEGEGIASLTHRQMRQLKADWALAVCVSDDIARDLKEARAVANRRGECIAELGALLGCTNPVAAAAILTKYSDLGLDDE